MRWGGPARCICPGAGTGRWFRGWRGGERATGSMTGRCGMTGEFEMGVSGTETERIS